MKKEKQKLLSRPKWLHTNDSSSLVILDVGTLIKHRKNSEELSSYIGNRLAASEESFVDVWLDQESNALAFDLGNALGLLVTTLTDLDGNIIEIKLVPERG